MYIKNMIQTHTHTHKEKNERAKLRAHNWLIIILILILDTHRDYNERVVTYSCTTCRHSAMRFIEFILQQVTESHT